VPDWKAIVAQKLKQFDLELSTDDEVAAELSAHLEDRYEQLLAQGMADTDVYQAVLEETQDWQGLACSIKRTKRMEDVMNRRTKILWLPGLVTFTTASILLMALQRLVDLHPALLLSLERITGLHPTLWWKDQVDAIYVCWWVLLPLCGAAGAFLSRRSGGSRLACVAASLFPSIVMFLVFCFVLPVNIIIGKNSFVMQHPLYFVLAMVNWIMVPGFALILGALPFFRQTVEPEAPPQT
jgi:hypothetical protein